MLISLLIATLGASLDGFEDLIESQFTSRVMSTRKYRVACFIMSEGFSAAFFARKLENAKISFINLKFHLFMRLKQFFKNKMYCNSLNAAIIVNISDIFAFRFHFDCAKKAACLSIFCNKNK